MPRKIPTQEERKNMTPREFREAINIRLQWKPEEFFTEEQVKELNTHLFGPIAADRDSFDTRNALVAYVIAKKHMSVEKLSELSVQEMKQYAAEFTNFVKQHPIFANAENAEPDLENAKEFGKICGSASAKLIRLTIPKVNTPGEIEKAVSEMAAPSCATAGVQSFLNVYRNSESQMPENVRNAFKTSFNEQIPEYRKHLEINGFAAYTNAFYILDAYCDEHVTTVGKASIKFLIDQYYNQIIGDRELKYDITDDDDKNAEALMYLVDDLGEIKSLGNAFSDEDYKRIMKNKIDAKDPLYGEILIGIEEEIKRVEGTGIGKHLPKMIKKSFLTELGNAKKQREQLKEQLKKETDEVNNYNQKTKDLIEELQKTPYDKVVDDLQFTSLPKKESIYPVLTSTDGQRNDTQKIDALAAQFDTLFGSLAKHQLPVYQQRDAAHPEFDFLSKFGFTDRWTGKHYSIYDFAEQACLKNKESTANSHFDLNPFLDYENNQANCELATKIMKACIVSAMKKGHELTYPPMERSLDPKDQVFNGTVSRSQIPFTIPTFSQLDLAAYEAEKKKRQQELDKQMQSIEESRKKNDAEFLQRQEEGKKKTEEQAREREEQEKRSAQARIEEEKERKRLEEIEAKKIAEQKKIEEQKEKEEKERRRREENDPERKKLSAWKKDLEEYQKEHPDAPEKDLPPYLQDVEKYDAWTKRYNEYREANPDKLEIAYPEDLQHWSLKDNLEWWEKHHQEMEQINQYQMRVINEVGENVGKGQNEINNIQLQDAQDLIQEAKEPKKETKTKVNIPAGYEEDHGGLQKEDAEKLEKVLKADEKKEDADKPEKVQKASEKKEDAEKPEKEISLADARKGLNAKRWFGLAGVSSHEMDKLRDATDRVMELIEREKKYVPGHVGFNANHAALRAELIEKMGKAAEEYMAAKRGKKHANDKNWVPGTTMGAKRFEAARKLSEYAQQYKKEHSLEALAQQGFEAGDLKKDKFASKVFDYTRMEDWVDRMKSITSKKPESIEEQNKIIEDIKETAAGMLACKYGNVIEKKQGEYHWEFCFEDNANDFLASQELGQMLTEIKGKDQWEKAMSLKRMSEKSNGDLLVSTHMKIYDGNRRREKEAAKKNGGAPVERESVLHRDENRMGVNKKK